MEQLMKAGKLREFPAKALGLKYVNAGFWLVN
jgi:hypothetical protein